jgi:hypothetical protein
MGSEQFVSSSSNSVEVPVEPGQQTALVLPGQFVLPNPNDLPAAGAQCAGHEPIAGLVGRNLFAPERGVVLRLRALLGAVLDLSAFCGGSRQLRRGLALEQVIRQKNFSVELFTNSSRFEGLV